MEGRFASWQANRYSQLNELYIKWSVVYNVYWYYHILPLSSEVVVAPPAVYLQYVREKLSPSVAVAGQNCYKAEKGAFTGEIRY